MRTFQFIRTHRVSGFFFWIEMAATTNSQLDSRIELRGGVYRVRGSGEADASLRPAGSGEANAGAAVSAAASAVAAASGGGAGASAAAAPPRVYRASTLSLEERFALVRSVGEECIQVRRPPRPIARSIGRLWGPFLLHASPPLALHHPTPPTPHRRKKSCSRC